ncbi:UNVERIFIED_CONTAM: hypothetical protein K2H54_038331 [Gekko kuhli]
MSDDVELLVLGPWLPIPTISLSHIQAPALGNHVTIYCQNQYWHPAVKFYLQKPGDQVPQHLMETDGDEGKFTISNVSWKDAGKYSCSFCPEFQPFLLSNTSDPLELLIIDPGLPKPNISLSPGRRAVPGSNITITCWVKDPVETFYLWKEQGQTKTQSMKPNESVAIFSLSKVQLDDGGNYNCIYRPHAAFLNSSEPSSSVQLLVQATPEVPVPVSVPDYTNINIIRLAVGGLILLLLTYMMIADHLFWKEQNKMNISPVHSSSSHPYEN